MFSKKKGASWTYDTPSFFERCKDVRTTKVKKNIKKTLENLEMSPKSYTFVS